METRAERVLLDIEECDACEEGVLEPNYADNKGFYGTTHSDVSYGTQTFKKQTISEKSHVTKRKDIKHFPSIRTEHQMIPVIDEKNKNGLTKLKKLGLLIGVFMLCGLVAFVGVRLAISTSHKHTEIPGGVTNDMTDQNVRLAESAGVLSPPVCAPCSNTTRGVFPNLDYAAFGYNYLSGYPLTVGHDPGLTHPIFMVTYKTDKKTADCSYSVPDGYDVIKDVSCATGFTSDVITTSTQFSKVVSHSASAHLGVFGFKFSANSQYKTDVTQISTGQSVYILSQAKCQQFFTQLSAFNPPPFHPTFLTWVERLQNTTDEREYLDFISYYGTHFITETAFGAQYMKFFSMTTKSYQEMRSRNVNVQAKASLSIFFFHAGASYDYTETEKQEIKNFRSHLAERTISKGTPPPYDLNDTKWANQASTTPAPISYHLMALDQLFTDKYMARLPAELNIDYENIRQNLLHIMSIKHPKEIFDRSTNIHCRCFPRPFKLPSSFCFDTQESKLVHAKSVSKLSRDGSTKGKMSCSSNCLETSDCLGATVDSSGSEAKNAYPKCHVLFRLSNVAEKGLVTSSEANTTQCHSYLFPYRLSSNYGQSNQPEWLRVRGVTSDKKSGLWTNSQNPEQCEARCVRDFTCVAVITMATSECGIFTQSQIEEATLMKSDNLENTLGFVKVC